MNNTPAYLLPVPKLNSGNYLILFILWPFLSFMLAVINFSQKEARKVIYIFFIYYGLTFVISELGGYGPDAERQALRLITAARQPFSEFFKIVGDLYVAEDSVDLIQPLLIFFVSRFTNDYGFLFAIYAAFFGFFYLKSIKLVYRHFYENPGYNSLIHLIFFVLIIPITFINGFRMWTAAWIFFFGAYNVVLNRDPRYLLIALCSSFVHFSFFSASAVLAIYYFAGNRNIIYFPLAAVSFVLPQLLAPLFQSLSLRLGGGIQNRYEGYAGENYILHRQDELAQGAWFLRMSNDLVLYYLLFAIFIIQLNSKTREKTQEEKNLYSFTLLFLSFVNFGSIIPSFGGRFMLVFFLFATLYIIYYFMKISGTRINWLTIIGLFPMLLYIIVNLRIGFPSVNAWIFVPGLGLPLFMPDLSLFEVLF